MNTKTFSEHSVRIFDGMALHISDRSGCGGPYSLIDGTFFPKALGKNVTIPVYPEFRTDTRVLDKLDALDEDLRVGAEYIHQFGGRWAAAILLADARASDVLEEDDRHMPEYILDAFGQPIGIPGAAGLLQMANDPDVDIKWIFLDTSLVPGVACLLESGDVEAALKVALQQMETWRREERAVFLYGESLRYAGMEAAGERPSLDAALRGHREWVRRFEDHAYRAETFAHRLNAALWRNGYPSGDAEFSLFKCLFLEGEFGDDTRQALAAFRRGRFGANRKPDSDTGLRL